MNYTYNPTQWHTGDIITENKLNNMEEGIVNAYEFNKIDTADCESWGNYPPDPEQGGGSISFT